MSENGNTDTSKSSGAPDTSGQPSDSNSSRSSKDSQPSDSNSSRSSKDSQPDYSVGMYQFALETGNIDKTSGYC